MLIIRNPQPVPAQPPRRQAPAPHIAAPQSSRFQGAGALSTCCSTSSDCMAAASSWVSSLLTKWFGGGSAPQQPATQTIVVDHTALSAAPIQSFDTMPSSISDLFSMQPSLMKSGQVHPEERAGAEKPSVVAPMEQGIKSRSATPKVAEDESSWDMVGEHDYQPTPEPDKKSD